MATITQHETFESVELSREKHQVRKDILSLFTAWSRPQSKPLRMFTLPGITGVFEHLLKASLPSIGKPIDLQCFECKKSHFKLADFFRFRKSDNPKVREAHKKLMDVTYQRANITKRINEIGLQSTDCAWLDYCGTFSDRNVVPISKIKKGALIFYTFSMQRSRYWKGWKGIFAKKKTKCPEKINFTMARKYFGKDIPCTHVFSRYYHNPNKNGGKGTAMYVVGYHFVKNSPLAAFGFTDRSNTLFNREYDRMTEVLKSNGFTREQIKVHLPEVPLSVAKV